MTTCASIKYLQRQEKYYSLIFTNIFKKAWKGIPGEGDQLEKQHLLSLNWPPALIKALDDPFKYFVVLASGETFYFERAEYLNNDFVRLRGLRPNPNQFDYPRGIEVRVSEITSIADAPEGV